MGFTRLNFSACSGVVSGQSLSKVMGLFLACFITASISSYPLQILQHLPRVSKADLVPIAMFEPGIDIARIEL